MAAILQKSAFTREVVDRYSREHCEPEWVRQRRFEGLVLHEELPLPEGRQLDWGRLNFGALTPSRDAGVDHRVGASYSPAFAMPDLLKHGVVFCDMHTALRHHPELVEKYFMSTVPVRSSKFAALHAAFWTNGTFLYVPKGIEVTMPLRSDFCGCGLNAAHFLHTLVVVERNAKLTYIDNFKSRTEAAGQGLFDGITELFVGEGANVVYVAQQQWGRHVWDVSTRRAVLDRDANLTWLNLGLGGAVSKMRIESALTGPGCSVEMLGVTIAQAGQQFHYDTLQDHRVPNTKSDLLFKAALKSGSRTVYEGTIKVHKAAQRTDAYQASRNLLLGKDARADATPILEIEANDVRCTHGATVGPVDQKQLFYLRSRGISEADASGLLVRGFLDQAMRYIDAEVLRDELWQSIEGGITAS